MEISQTIARQRFAVNIVPVDKDEPDWAVDEHDIMSPFARIQMPMAHVIERMPESDQIRAFSVRIGQKDYTFRSNDWNHAMTGVKGVRSVVCRELEDGGVMLIVKDKLRDIPSTNDNRRKRAEGYRDALLREHEISLKPKATKKRENGNGLAPVGHQASRQFRDRVRPATER